MRLLLSLMASIICTICWAQNNTVGTIYNQTSTTDGYSLFSPNNRQQTYLIDNCGRLINSWNSNYFPGLSAYLHSDASLYRTARIISPGLNGNAIGGRIERYDWDANLIWSYNYRANHFTPHHDFALLPNGNVVLIVAFEYSDSAAFAMGRDSALLSSNTLWEERLVELRPIGIDSAEIVWEWRSWDHLIQDLDSTKLNFGIIEDHPELIDINYAPVTGRDWLHFNSISYNATYDQLVVSVRDLNEVWVIDHSTTTAEAATNNGGNSGKGGDLLYRWGNPQSYRAGDSSNQVLFGQHDVQWVGDSQIVVYNNAPNRGFASIELWEAPLQTNGSYTVPIPGQAFAPSQTTWTYNLPDSFSSPRLSGAEVLPNGHKLICSGSIGYLREIDAQDNIVWEYINPAHNSGITSQGDPPSLGNQIFISRKYLQSDSMFQNINTSPQIPIEQNYNLQTCLSSHQQSIITDETEQPIHLYPNPSSGILQIESKLQLSSIQLYNQLGIQVYEKDLNTYFWQGDFSQLPKGHYILKVNSEQNKSLIIRSITLL